MKKAIPNEDENSGFFPRCASAHDGGRCRNEMSAERRLELRQRGDINGKKEKGQRGPWLGHPGQAAGHDQHPGGGRGAPHLRRPEGGPCRHPRSDGDGGCSPSRWGRRPRPFPMRWTPTRPTALPPPGAGARQRRCRGRRHRHLAGPPSPGQIEALLPRFTGPIVQVPPSYSAIKVQGERAYDLARDGETVVLEPRTVEVFEARLLAAAPDTAEFEIRCGKGTYVRAWCATWRSRWEPWAMFRPCAGPGSAGCTKKTPPHWIP